MKNGLSLQQVRLMAFLLIGSPDEKALEEAELLGKRVAKLTLKLHDIPQSE
jgi:hypothetical protein